VREDVTVELCHGCKGMLIDEHAFEQLAGPCDLGALSADGVALAGLGPCLRCNTANWQWRALAGEVGAGVGMCGTCGMLWFQAGELDRLQRHLLAERRRARRRMSTGAPTASAAEPRGAGAAVVETAAIDAGPALATAHAVRAVPQRDGEPFEPISFDAGAGNRLGVPLALAFGFGFGATSAGQFFGSLLSMPFHELGHALASWLGSRFAVPLPFFTVWSEERSLWFGLALAALLAWFGLRSLRERRRFGLVVAGALLGTQLWLSCFVSARASLMCQILGGALGEIVLGGFVLVAFHFPLPARLRWDFWRWPALLPGGVCFAHAALTWLAAARDARRIPWGSAIGDESDGDMNRLVNVFEWSAAGLARFYLAAACLTALGIGAAYLLALGRGRVQGIARMERQKSMS
jgi:hypothetical protein